jgi:23S rRNA (guanosine2251-2'-O)-methyltransferase
MDVTDLPYRATAAGASYDPIPRLPVSVLLHNVRSAYNVGAFFRTLDAVGGAHLYLAGISPTPAHRGVAKTALGAETTLPWTQVEDATPTIDALHREGWTIAAIETLTPAIDLFEWQPAFPVCLLFGHEVDGLAPEIVERASARVRIPMLGHKQSLNVATSGGVVLYELLRKYRVVAQARPTGGRA